MNATKNIVANLSGRIWSAVMNFAFVPIYIHVLGIEAYGLIGFFVSLLAIFLFLDMGLSTAINREMARSGAGPDTVGQARTLMRTLETVYWGVGLAMGLAIILLAPTIGREWLHPHGISTEATITAVRLMGVVAILRWPVALYTGALMGLNRQVNLNIVTSIYATVQAGGAALIIYGVSPTVNAFFLWQVFAAALQIFFLIRLTWRSLAADEPGAVFSVRMLRGVLAFSAGVTGITILSIVLTQLDKFLLSSLLPLTQFGYYALAGAIAGTLNIAAISINGAMFPIFSRLVEARQLDELRALYHRSAQLLSLIVMPAGLTLAFFSPELLAAYVGDPVIVEKTHLLLSYLVIGNVLLSVMVLPLALQLAYGWTSLSLVKNIVAVVIFAPMLLIFVQYYGAVGAGMAWIVLTIGYVLFEIPIMHRRLLKHEMWHWYLIDVGIPAIISVVVLGLAWAIIPRDMSLLITLAAIALAGAFAAALSAALLPESRRWILALAGLTHRADRGVAQ
ncbi:oligosaccharide flippase family protein [Sphingomonas sp. 7/4-4]|uniref:oligosaccharide flippase family protein n=1 Tax=Sphingomonas sp. 7/4-4 TaxID=3018446 RepID=UPI0022F3848E|nr:oligosaccharide flippase family protein [Sphingomonas sp. 7/4-4]WBY07961.1 oligosaccharide flippase family protein [Sphingomonas sp. 7/4-4]